MRLTTILLAALPALASALPYENAVTASPACIAQQWAIQGFSEFTAPPGPLKPNTPPVFGASHLSFRFDDPNTGLSTSCHRALEAGKGGSVADAHHRYACEDSRVKYQFDGEVLVVAERVVCDGKKVTAYGTIQGAVNCYEQYGGQTCATAVDLVNVIPVIH